MQKENRKQAIKDMLKMLHDGKTTEEVKQYFSEVFGSVSAKEISEAEQALIADGMPVEEIHNLCDIHAEVFKGGIEAPKTIDEHDAQGHPIWVIKQENIEINKLLEQVNIYLQDWKNGKSNERLLDSLTKLTSIKTHYQRKENILFPYLEKHGVSGPPKVMWSVDDEIRENLSSAIIAAQEAYSEQVQETIKKATDGISEMIFKEENILIPMMLEMLSREEWQEISKELPSIGYGFITPPPIWHIQSTDAVKKSADSDRASIDGQVIKLPTGVFEVDELVAMLNTLPIDISFVDKDDNVKYFSEAKERIFPRTKSVIGRNASNCHPPASVHIVEKILSDFKNNVKDEESFWINMRGQFVYIRYFAVRNSSGEYLGTLEVTQNIAPLLELKGEKRLLSE